MKNPYRRLAAGLLASLFRSGWGRPMATDAARKFLLVTLFAVLTGAAISALSPALSTTPANELFAAYEEACRGVRDQSNEDEALGCFALREDRESMRLEIASYASSLCEHLDRACGASEDRSRVPRILRFGLAAGCVNPMPACGGRDDQYANQTPAVIQTPASCRALGATAAVAQVRVGRGGPLRIVNVMLADASGSDVSWAANVNVDPDSPTFMAEVQRALDAECTAYVRATPEPALRAFGRWILEQTRSPLTDEDRARMRGVLSSVIGRRG